MRSLIQSNPLRLVILLWFAGWLLLVMPGHKRGIVQLPDAEAQNVAAEESCCEPKSCCEPAPSCCSTEAADETACERDAQEDGETPPGDPAKHCAICFLKAHMTDPPPVTLYTPYLGELDELVYLTESSVAQSQAAPARVRGRAPPV